VNSQPLLAPALDERELEHLEATFLRSPIGFWPSGSETRLPVAEMLSPAAACPVDDDQPFGMTRYRTRGGCCG